MALGVDLSILNQKGTPAFFSDIFANRPAFGFAGRVFISTDTGAIYEDTGTAWTLIADAGAGTTGTLQQVTTNGNTTTQGISITAGGLSSNSITNTSLTTGSVAFVGAAGLMTEDNANFFWDDTNNRLGLGTITPTAKLDIHGSGAMALFNGTGANNGYIGFQNAGSTKWTIGNLYNAGVNSFEFLSAAFSTLVMSLRSNGSAQEIYMNGYNTISNVANFSSAGNYASNPSLTIAIPTSTVFNNGASWSGLATSLLNTWGSNNTVTNGASFAGIIGVNRNSFSNAGVTITVDQATGNRAIAGLVVLSQTGGTNNGTISHGASLLVQGVYPTGTANVTYTNYYGLLLNQLDEFGTVTFTNRWGIYQGGASDKNYFAANTLIGTTTDAGYKLDVNGTGRFSAATSAITLTANGAANQWTAKILASSTTSQSYGLTVQAGTNASDIAFQVIPVSGSGSLLQILGTGAASFSSSVTAGSDIKINNSGTTISNIAATSSEGGLNLYSGATADYNGGGLITLVSSDRGGAYTRGEIYISAGRATNNTANGFIALSTSDTERMRITSGGNILVGSTTDTGGKLQVTGAVNATQFAVLGGGVVYLYNDNNANYWYQRVLVANSNNLRFNYNGSDKAEINNATGVYVALSDINVKKDFEQSTIGLNAILGLKPTLYRMKSEDNTEKHLGFIAQEVKEFIPQAYVENEDFIGLSDRPIIAALVKAIQELNNKLVKNNIN